MTKPIEITATVRPNADEVVQVSVSIPDPPYPDCFDEACAKVRRLIHDLTADQIKLYARVDQATVVDETPPGGAAGR